MLCAWRLTRAYRIETGLFRKARKAWSNGTAAHTNEIAVVFLRLALKRMIAQSSPAMRSASSAPYSERFERWSGGEPRDEHGAVPRPVLLEFEVL